MMTVRNLNKDQIHQLKESYFTELVNEGIFAETLGVEYDAPSWGDLANVDEIISDEVVMVLFDGIVFCEEDFWDFEEEGEIYEENGIV